LLNEKELILSEPQLEDNLSQPTKEVIDTVTRLDGDYIILGIAGKIGPSLARMLKRALKEANKESRVIGVSRFSDQGLKKKLEDEGIDIFQGDLLDSEFIKSLPKVRNVIFLAGMKFGSVENLEMTWAVNSYLPAMIVEQFSSSRIVAFSTGCVYELVPIKSGGSLESDIPKPIGEYAQSCLGRERMFEYGSKKNNTKVILIRLNYAVELRYGVLVDLALKAWNDEPVDLVMGYFNVMWQSEVNELTIRALEYCESPVKKINMTGAEILSVKECAEQFGKLFNKKVKYTGKEASTALLSNAQESYRLFGRPKIGLEQMMIWIAAWIKEGNRILNKPTHFEVRDGKY